MATKLGVYQAALIALGERQLASLTEAREPRRVLDGNYDQAVAECLEAGQWLFALRTVSLDSDPSITPTFGYAYGFTKPTDWVRTAGIASDETFSAPLVRFIDETDYWQADIDPIYVRYVSNDATFGMDLSRWPASFTRYVSHYLAQLSCERITQNASKMDRLERLTVPRARANALNNDAMNAPTRFLPAGRLVHSRGGGRSGLNGRSYDRG